MQFITYDENNNSSLSPVQFGHAVCGIGHHELLITHTDIEDMKRFRSDQIGDYFINVIIPRSSRRPAIKCPPPRKSWLKRCWDKFAPTMTAPSGPHFKPVGLSRPSSKRTAHEYKDALIAKQQLEIEHLKDKVADLTDNCRNVRKILFCCSGPMNGNLLQYDKKQLTTFAAISDAVGEI